MKEVKYLGQGNITVYESNGQISYLRDTDTLPVDANLIGAIGGADLFETEDYQLHDGQYSIKGETFFVCHSPNGLPIVEELPIDQLNLWQ